MPKFKINDRVELAAGKLDVQYCCSSNPELKIGMMGVVIEDSSDSTEKIGISFEGWNYGHRLGGRIATESGQWICKDHLELHKKTVRELFKNKDFDGFKKIAKSKFYAKV